MTEVTSDRLLILALPDLGGIGKSTLSEQLVAMHEIAGRPVVAIDGDPTSRGLLARRYGRPTIQVKWPEEHISRARAIRDAVKPGQVGVLDFGGGSTLTLSVDPTIAELCDGSTDHGVKTVVIVIGESSKPGLASAITRLRATHPHVSYIFCRNHKSGTDWSSFKDCADLPSFYLPAIPIAITEWLANHRVVKDDRGEVSRPALADLVTKPLQDYSMIGGIILRFLETVSQQPAMQDLLGLPPTNRQSFGLRNSLVLGRGPMTDDYIAAHQRASGAMAEIVGARPPQPGQEGPWIERMGRAVLKYAENSEKLRAARTEQPR